jgi:hypothetical protein
MCTVHIVCHHHRRVQLGSQPFLCVYLSKWRNACACVDEEQSKLDFSCTKSPSSSIAVIYTPSRKMAGSAAVHAVVVGVQRAFSMRIGERAHALLVNRHRDWLPDQANAR